MHQKIRPKDVPGTLLNMALLNLGSSDPNLRTAAYNQLCALTATFDLKIEVILLINDATSVFECKCKLNNILFQGQLLETWGLCIPSNNTLFIKSVSEKLAFNEPRLTLEFLEECIHGYINIKSLISVLEHLANFILNYMNILQV